MACSNHCQVGPQMHSPEHPACPNCTPALLDSRPQEVLRSFRMFGFKFKSLEAARGTDLLKLKRSFYKNVFLFETGT